jgi:hypothetical protein
MKKRRPCLCEEAKSTKKTMNRMATGVNSMLAMSDRKFRDRVSLTLVDVNDIPFCDIRGTRRTKVKMIGDECDVF